MTHQEAVEKYREALGQYHDQWYGHGSSVGPFSATEQGRESYDVNHRAALSAPDVAKEEIKAAGLNFRAVWQEVHGVDPDTIPALKGRL